ncbi:MAG: 3-deoxy-manno-octulosonate cytidylyltransferase [Bdellovibrionota bacterium]
MNKKIVAVIPARMASSRFPGKPMAKLHGMPMIGHVYLRTRMSKVLDATYVATCDQEIFDYITSIGGKAVMTKDTHERCTDRTFEAVEKIEKEIGPVGAVVMVQGDEPMTTPEMIEASVRPILERKDVRVVNLKGKITSEEEFQSPNTIKLVSDINNNAIYFSREPVPSRKKWNKDIPMFKQVCVISFSRDYLSEYSRLAPTPLEVIESIDMNRVLEHGDKVFLVETNEASHAVDTQDDLKAVEKLMTNDPLMKKYL